MTERLDRIEAAIEANAAQIKTNATQIKTNSVAIAELRATVNSLVQVVEIHQHNHAELRATVNSLVQVVEIHQGNHEVSQRNFEAIMNEIRGIRTENQRILEHLFGKQED